MSLKLKDQYFLFASLFREAPTVNLLQAIAKDFSREEVAVEFASLFLVPGEGMIPSYESFYCDTLTIDTSTACSAYFEPEVSPQGLKGFLCGPSTRSVQKAYEAFGFELGPSFHDLPDHVSVELEFMGRLLGSGKEEEADRFFREHLGRWIGLFLDKVAMQQVSSFYRSVAPSLKEFLAEGKFLKHDLSHTKGIRDSVM